MVPLTDVVRSWGRIGVLGFGGPPAHIRMLRELTVERRGWISPEEFEDAVATCNLLPGPSSTQMAIYTAWRVAGARGALVGGTAFILPGLVVILALAAIFLDGEPPRWVLGLGAGAGAAVPGVAVSAGWSLAPSSWARAASHRRWVLYLVAGLVATPLVGAWVVAVLLACGVLELLVQHPRVLAVVPPLLAPAAVGGGTLAGLMWLGFKVGALSYGGGFVVIPLMQADAVDRHHWMSGADFLNAVALGQITPGPVTHTIAVVGYAAAGLGGALLADAVAFVPSYLFVLVGGRHFDRIRASPPARAVLDGAGPAAIGAILGSAITLARALSEPWQFAVLAGALVLILVLRRGVVTTLLLAAAVGVFCYR
ncbi:chromate efflux transporter [Nocardioides sp. BP30]|uniref:chromate efflux transporter n=1 Tax=Nocardioides sp. BP30 TaxID=3036374 RepID=UPI0024694758|nr:chromate efflux transporter [Nocardioides sp. BP30]WGL52432.1 chromate efflux transporter [Nocardioides sp. BP30]